MSPILIALMLFFAVIIGFINHDIKKQNKL